MRKIALFIMAVLAFGAIGCAEIVVLERDEGTIQNFREQKQFYIEDISDSGQLGGRDPEETDFPIGDLTWMQYSATLQTFDSAIAREEAKQTREELEDAD